MNKLDLNVGVALYRCLLFVYTKWGFLKSVHRFSFFSSSPYSE